MKLHQISPPIMCTASTPLGGIQGGYYTVASRYEFYVQVAWTISHEWAQRTSEIFLPWEDFRPLSEDFWRFSKIVPKARRTFPTFSENFRKFPKISEDFQRLLRKTRRCFDDTPTNLSTIKETNLISVKSSISSHTCEDIISTHVRISNRFYQFVTIRYTTDFCIINAHLTLSHYTQLALTCI